MGAPNGCVASSFEDSSDLSNPHISLKRLFYTEGISLTPHKHPPPAWVTLLTELYSILYLVSVA